MPATFISQGAPQNVASQYHQTQRNDQSRQWRSLSIWVHWERPVQADYRAMRKRKKTVKQLNSAHHLANGRGPLIHPQTRILSSRSQTLKSPDRSGIQCQAHWLRYCQINQNQTSIHLILLDQMVSSPRTSLQIFGLFSSRWRLCHGLYNRWDVHDEAFVFGEFRSGSNQ